MSLVLFLSRKSTVTFMVRHEIQLYKSFSVYLVFYTICIWFLFGVFIELLLLIAASVSATHDARVPNQANGALQLIELQQRVKAGSLTVDGAPEGFSTWQPAQEGMDAVQQVWGPSHCDRTHTGLGVSEHAGPNPNASISICCSCRAKLQSTPLPGECVGTSECT